MKLPLCITLMIFSLLLVMFASTTESRKELKDNWYKNVMEDESLPNLKPLFIGSEKLFIKELEPSTDNALPAYKMKRSSPTFFQKKPIFIKAIEPQPIELEPVTDNVLLFYKMERSSPTFFQEKSTSIKDIEPQSMELEPSTDNALLAYKMERSSPTFFQKKLASIKDLEPTPLELEPSTDNALLAYKMERSSPTFFQKKPTSIKAIEAQPIELESSTDNALLAYKMEHSSPSFFHKKLASIKDLEPTPLELEPSTDNALLGYKMERSSPTFFEKKPASIKDIEPQPMELEPSTDNALLGYKMERSSPTFFQKKSASIKAVEPRPIELEPSTDNALLVYKMERSSPTFFQKKPNSIKNIEHQPIELESSTDNALLGYKMERSSPTSLKNPIIRMVTGHGSQEINPTEHNMKDMLYFTINDLKLGKKFPFYLHQNDPSTTPSLSKEIADSIPFSLKQLPQILNFFSFPSDSSEAQIVENALRLCEREPVEGETKFCTTSMKSMVDFVSSALGFGGKSSSVKYLATTLLTKFHTNLQNYTLLQMPNEIKVSKYFACHALRYPYVIRYCHSRFGDTKLLQFPMEGENGDRVQALAVCHMDTSEWNPKHPSFKVLNTVPGTFPICHIMPLTDFIWFPISTST